MPKGPFHTDLTTTIQHSTTPLPQNFRSRHQQMFIHWATAPFLYKQTQSNSSTDKKFSFIAVVDGLRHDRKHSQITATKQTPDGIADFANANCVGYAGCPVGHSSSLWVSLRARATLGKRGTRKCEIMQRHAVWSRDWELTSVTGWVGVKNSSNTIVGK